MRKTQLRAVVHPWPTRANHKGTGYRYVFQDTSRQGQRRTYFWRGKGHEKIRVREDLGSPAFQAKYAELLKGSVPTEALLFRKLVAAYIGSPNVKATHPHGA